MIQVKMADGFECSIDEEALNNWELLELLQDIDSGQTMKMIPAMRMFFGLEQYEALKNHLRGANGAVKIDAMAAAFSEVMGAVKHGKK